MRIARMVCRMGGAGVSSSSGMKCGLSCWVRGVAVVAVVRVDWRTGGVDTVGGCAGGCCLADRSTQGVGTFVGLMVGRRSWIVHVVGLVIGQVHIVCCGGSSICLMKGLKWGPPCWLLAWTVYVVDNVFVFIIRSEIFQEGKWVVTSCVSLMDGPYQSYVCWCRGII
jgi:hypothetical protein